MCYLLNSLTDSSHKILAKWFNYSVINQNNGKKVG